MLKKHMKLVQFVISTVNDETQRMFAIECVKQSSCGCCKTTNNILRKPVIQQPNQKQLRSPKPVKINQKRYCQKPKTTLNTTLHSIHSSSIVQVVLGEEAKKKKGQAEVEAGKDINTCSKKTNKQKTCCSYDQATQTTTNCILHPAKPLPLLFPFPLYTILLLVQLRQLQTVVPI